MIIVKRLILAFVFAGLVGLLVFLLNDNPFRIQIGFASAVLVLLLTGQVYFIVQRSRARPRNLLRDPQPQTETTKPVKKAKKGTLTDQIDPEVFSRFQESIDQSEKSRNESDQAGEEVVLSISSKGKKALSDTASGIQPNLAEAGGTPPTEKPATSHKGDPVKSKQRSKKPVEAETRGKEEVPAESIGSLFDDIQEPLADIEEVKSAPKKKKIDKIESPPEISPDDSEPIMAHEVLTSEDLQPDEEDARDEAELVLSVAQKQYENGEFKEGIETTSLFLSGSLTKLSKPKYLQKLVQLKGECEFQLQQYDGASKTWHEIFQKFMKKDEPEFLPLLEETIDKFKNAGKQQYAVHFLFTALNEYRQVQNLPKMDETYLTIEDAYNQQEDWKRLIQTYQNHLTIKRTLKDHKGQLDILDHLGKMLYDQGDAEGSRKCYEQRLAIETQMKKK